MTISSVEDNKAIMRYIVDRNDARDSYAYLDKVAENFVGHHHFVPEDLHGNRSLSDFFYVTEAMAFPDGSHTIQNLFGEGEFVALELSFIGTFTGDLPIGIPANGERVRFQYSIICRFEDSKLAELWWYPLDSYKLMQELGMLKNS